MTRSMWGSTGQVLGDSHNFGRRVTRRGHEIEKPRTLLWEWLVLAPRSPLRRALVAAARAEGNGELFSFLPSLSFRRPSAKHGGVVESLELRPLPRLSRTRRRELARVGGRVIALFSWLGVADLHWENLALGVDRDGRIVFTPLDIELILSELWLPTETKLLPDADPEIASLAAHAAGVRRLLPALGKPVEPADVVAMAGAYREMLELLDRHARAIADALLGVRGLHDAPIRVLLRSTGEYVTARSVPPWPPLLDAESEQLERGDIPYFFRLIGRAGVHYFADRSLRTVKRLPMRGDVPRLEPLLSLRRGLKAPSRRSLREQGLFAVLAALDEPSFRGVVEDERISVTFAARSIGVRLEGREELLAKRDLSASVGSAYQPCRCGEVRSVFVPSVTRCDLAGRG